MVNTFKKCFSHVGSSFKVIVNYIWFNFTILMRSKLAVFRILMSMNFDQCIFILETSHFRLEKLPAIWIFFKKAYIRGNQ